MNRMIQKGIYGSKSEIVREALRMLFEKYGEKIWEPSQLHKWLLEPSVR